MKNIVIVGGGSAGLKVASKLAKRNDIKITVIDPASKHYLVLPGGFETLY